MKIESVDFFYLSMPEVLDIGDGSQDALLVRVRAGGLEGWGECEASPLTSIASYICPMSHSACKPLRYAVEGRNLNSAADIAAISASVRQHSSDLLQADHTLSGIDIALWDLLGKQLDTPVYKLLGYKKAYPKLPYASQLFGEDAEETFKKARIAANSGFKAVKFGWGPFGTGTVEQDIAQLSAAREGLGPDIQLMVDAGTVWNEDTTLALMRLQPLKKVEATWLEEPFQNLALNAYKKLSQTKPEIPLAGGEGCSNVLQAQAMIEYAGIQFMQVDAGRIGGISAAKKVADLVVAAGISYVNHTFTSHLALSASIQAYAGLEKQQYTEYPIEPSPLARAICRENLTKDLTPDLNGLIHLPASPGLGMQVDTLALKKYQVAVDISVNGKQLYYSPEF